MNNLIKMLTVVCLCFAAIPYASAQRNLPGQKAIQMGGGLVDGFSLKKSGGEYNYYGSLHFIRSNRNQTRWIMGLGYQQKDYNYRNQIIPKAQFTGEIGYFIPFLYDRGRNISLSAGISALGGYETSNWGDKGLHDGATLMNKDCFIWGGALTAEMEMYITDRFIFLINVKERALFGTDMGNFHTQLGIGIRIVIN